MNLDYFSKSFDTALLTAALHNAQALRYFSGLVNQAWDTRPPRPDKPSRKLKSTTVAGARLPSVPGARPQAGDAKTGVEQKVPQPGSFTRHTYTDATSELNYKLYIPSSYGKASMPLIVMLHGCSQSSDDFALGTGMNSLAEEHGFLVAYPEQTLSANGTNCWNWFVPAEQTRDGVEPKSIAGIARQVGSRYRVNHKKVFVAGLSSGAAMAVILGDSYPDLFSAVAAHSGLPLGSARSMVSAFSAMQGRGYREPVPGRPIPSAEPSSAMRSRHVRTLVFHGDTDETVAPSNGADIESNAVASFCGGLPPVLSRESVTRVFGGRNCQVVRHRDGDGNIRVERWTVEGGAHTWFGGNKDGSYTDSGGPDASRECVRFFLAK